MSQFYQLTGFIQERLYSSFDKERNGYLSKKDFTTGMSNLFTGSFEILCEIIFNIYDFDKDNKITREDISVILSYIPLKTINEINTYKLRFEK